MSRVEDWAVWTLTGVAPFVVAGLLALCTPLFLPSRGLRRDLSLDAAMLDKLPAGSAQAELGEDVVARATKLVAWSRYPTLTRSEMFTFSLSAVILAGTFLKVCAELSGESPRTELGSLLAWVSLVASLAMWVLASWSWTERSESRLRYLAERSPADAVAAARGRVRTAEYVLVFVGGLIIVVQLAAVVNLALARWDSVLLIIAVTILWGVMVIGATLSLMASSLPEGDDAVDADVLQEARVVAGDH